MITLIADTLQVHILDFSAANKQLTKALNDTKNNNAQVQTELLHTETAESKLVTQYYFGAQYCALVDVNNRFFLIQPDARYIAPQINNIKDPVLLFELDVYEEFTDKQATLPVTTADLHASDVESLKTGVTVSLRQYMRENYNASKQNAFNVKEILNYVNSPAERNKYVIL